eukprot:CAMPEP_0175058604 /NCGR_PEP_ID=MMETSP0052_2-20121109/11946_1 /TAXON_ID=51329 ORGANISM="Polytomella parva, Strain SAG 63-3" /NCGR_SAMPLE_ID=MMETSP0052_2 /ASSEMBLY_ACC=CAM_ASM_000194 /LENGTH=275 /DNA_ID=CAMNT_0016324015 /DNA_START=40 /DNA_END=863 /DNA_ORIENTATION=-
MANSIMSLEEYSILEKSTVFNLPIWIDSTNLPEQKEILLPILSCFKEWKDAGINDFTVKRMSASMTNEVYECRIFKPLLTSRSSSTPKSSPPSSSAVIIRIFGGMNHRPDPSYSSSSFQAPIHSFSNESSPISAQGKLLGPIRNVIDAAQKRREWRAFRLASMTGQGPTVRARFLNGRAEGFLEGYDPTRANQIRHPLVSRAIAESLARFHCLGLLRPTSNNFPLPNDGGDCHGRCRSDDDISNDDDEGDEDSHADDGCSRDGKTTTTTTTTTTT